MRVLSAQGLPRGGGRDAGLIACVTAREMVGILHEDASEIRGGSLS